MNTNETLNSMLVGYIKELQALVDGDLYYIDGDFVVRDMDDESEEYNQAMDGETLANFCDWLDSYSLGDLRFEIGADGSFYGAKVLIAYGGPNIWLCDDRIEGYWGSEEVVIRLPQSVSEIVFDCFREEFDSVKCMWR